MPGSTKQLLSHLVASKGKVKGKGYFRLIGSSTSGQNTFSMFQPTNIHLALAIVRLMISSVSH